VKVLSQARSSLCLSPSPSYTDDFQKAASGPEKKSGCKPGRSLAGVRQGVDGKTKKEPPAI